MNKIIEETFKEMVVEIQKTKTKHHEPNRYHESASVNEINLIYHFAKQLEKKTKNCVVYLEFPCDSGRVDAVILYENNILLIEAKTKMDNKKYKILNAQAARFENNNGKLKLSAEEIDKNDDYTKKYFEDSSLRDTLKDRLHSYIEKMFNIKEDVNIYGILLADALSENEKNKWNYNSNQEHYEVYKLDCMKEYTLLDALEENDANSVWYLGGYKYIGTL
jgi:hypothetical protein